MFKRKIENELNLWKQSLRIKKKAFVLKGLRQTGKTSIIKAFAYKNYENVIYIDFKKEPSLKAAFNSDLVIDDIVLNISMLKPDVSFVPGKTVLILDEIQECSGARASIKFFMEDARFDVIASGSLLGIKGYNFKYKGGVSVGFEHTVYMKPMDFEEFLWAKGIPVAGINYLKECFSKNGKISDPINSSMLKYFKEYMCIGGMPSVVDVYLKTNNYGAARTEQKDILESYRDDFGKHLNESENEELDKTLLSRINLVFDSIPSQLAKENKKFIYSHLKEKGTSKMFNPAIQWLVDYGLVNKCFNLRTLSSPLEGNKIEDVFKLYFADTGLFISMLDFSAAGKIMSGDFGIYKGAIYENIVADSFSKNAKPLYYYSKDSGLEIDFVSEIDGDVTLIEVKAKNGNSKSSKTILSNKDKYPYVRGLIKLGKYNIGLIDGKLSAPYYLAFLLK